MRALAVVIHTAIWMVAICLIPWSAAMSASDQTQNFLDFPNFPVSDKLPTVPAPKLHDGLELAPGAASKAALTFTPGGTTDTREELDAQMYYNSIFGDQTKVSGVGIDGDTASNFTRPRRYRKGSPFDLLNFVPEGLNLGTICSMNNTSAGCRPGQVYGATLRLPTVILPGDIVSVTMRTGASPFFYMGPALYAAVQETPGPGGRPYEGTGALHYAKCYGEIDINDDYYVPGVALGHQLKMGIDAEYSYAANVGASCFKHAPHEIYDANGPNFSYKPNGGHPFFAIRKVATYAGMHTYTCWLTNDGSNLVHFFFDGVRVSTEYYEPSLSSYVDKSGTVHPVGYSLTIAAQTIPTFLNSNHNVNLGIYAHIVPNDGGKIIGGPWSATVQSIDIIKGSITPKSFRASTVDANGSQGEYYGSLRDHVSK